MDAATRALVRVRAGDRCEYCRLRQGQSRLTHHVEHIVARQHGGSDDPSNLALACHRCNLHKGPNLTGLDPASGDLTPLFDPRRDRWADHFDFAGPRLVGLTAIGRATIRVLEMNDERRVERRAELLALGEFT